MTTERHCTLREEHSSHPYTASKPTAYERREYY